MRKLYVITFVLLLAGTSWGQYVQILSEYDLFFSPPTTCIGDCDGDGVNEVVMGVSYGDVIITCYGTVEATIPSPTPPSDPNAGMFDVTGDGIPEIILHGAGRTFIYTYAGQTLDLPEPPSDIHLGQNYPNPFNPVTRIPYTLPARDQVDITIFNSVGQQVRRFNLGNKLAGAHTLEWDGTNGSGNQVASGMYFYQLQVGKTRMAKKMIAVQ
jgi:hypothetical protein